MKKILILGMMLLMVAAGVFVTLILTGVISFKNYEELIEYKNGDEVIRNGIVYTFVDLDELWGRNEVRVYDFNINDKLLFHHFYYFNMSDNKQEPITPFKQFNHWELRDDPDYDGPLLTEIALMYYRRARNDFFNLVHLIEAFTEHRQAGFFVSGFTSRVGRNVRVPESIHGNNVIGVGYRAFENSNIRMFSFESSLGGVILPYAFDNSNELREITLPDNSLLLSKSISNLARLERIHGANRPMEASLYNLPVLESISGVALSFQGIFMLGTSSPWIASPRRTIIIDLSPVRPESWVENTSFVVNTPSLRKMISRHSFVEIRMIEANFSSRTHRRFYQLFQSGTRLVMMELLEMIIPIV
ncbi:MAG: leucine-rich repeat domain-containing protein [Erysipelotrichales bacterium]|nr:leucine-rich repeat domain-containing protein [Erysipelotrichales bacterium]